MKILYVANERRSAQLAANALRSVAQDVTLTWAGSVSAALRWIQDNPDVAALVVDAEIQNQSCAPFVDHVRGLGLTTPVLVVAMERVGTPLAELKAGADDYVVNGQSLLTDLPLVLTRALQRTRAAAPRTPLRLLYVGDAALARRCLENPEWSIEITAVVPESSGRIPELPPGFDIVLVEYDHPGVDAFAILKDVAHRRPRVPAILVIDWDEKLAIPAFKLGAVDYVVKGADSFRALFFKLDRVPAVSKPLEGHAALNLDEVTSTERLQRQLRDALATASDTQRSFDTAAEHFRQREARLQAAIDQERATRDALEAKLAEAEASRRVAGEQRAGETSPGIEHAQRPAEDATELAQAAARRAALEERVAELEAELEDADQRSALEAAVAAERLTERESEFGAMLAGARTRAERARTDTLRSRGVASAS